MHMEIDLLPACPAERRPAHLPCRRVLGRHGAALGKSRAGNSAAPVD
jgi:hypothetical protein